MNNLHWQHSDDYLIMLGISVDDCKSVAIRNA